MFHVVNKQNYLTHVVRYVYFVFKVDTVYFHEIFKGHQWGSVAFCVSDLPWLRACPKGGTGRGEEDIEAVIWGGAGASTKHNSIRGARAACSNVRLR